MRHRSKRSFEDEVEHDQEREDGMIVVFGLLHAISNQQHMVQRQLLEASKVPLTPDVSIYDYAASTWEEYVAQGLPKAMVYFLTSKDLPTRYKIGKTKNLRSRMRALQGSCPVKLHSALEIPCAEFQVSLLEQAVHKRFARARLWGEWFEAIRFTDVLDVVEDGTRWIADFSPITELVQ